LHYTGSPLDRADAIRKDQQQIQALWSAPESIVLPVYELKNLVDPHVGCAVMPSRAVVGELIDSVSQPTFLGFREETAIFSFVCNEQQAGAWQSIGGGYRFDDLRKSGPSLPHAEASVLAYARGISYWQQLNRFCAACGSAVELSGGGHVLSCSSTDCGRLWFPRTDPAVIMLIERIDSDGSRYCLLGRSAQWSETVFSTLAGFVETGESLEQAVIREVYEEAGVVVENVRYVASQPWPFPQSLMVGFIGTATTQEITVDTTELAEARWFEAQELSTFGQWGDGSDGPKLPRPDSIARHLIDQWCTESARNP
jgi:NAD+ diphosphatase